MMPSDETAPPLSDAILATMRSRVQNIREMQDVGPENLMLLERWQLGAIAQAYGEDVPRLLCEIERLRGEVKLCVELLKLEG